MPNPAKLRLTGISKSFHVDNQIFPVLENIALEVTEGQFVSVIGPSGCGKTTLLKCIAGLDEPTSGTIELDGNVIGSRLGLIGFMPQKDLLLPWRTVLDNAMLGLEVIGRDGDQYRQQAIKMMDIFGIKEFKNRYPDALSGGMRQRVAFLRTLLVDQQLFLLDEPFGALDAFTRGQMQEWLLTIWSTFKKTVILITHDVEEAILLSDKVYVLSHTPGRVILELDVKLDRPREYGVLTDPQFIDFKKTLIDALRAK
ncbi:ABC transporter ATP-binding protein [SAR202 cluster bacterium AC-409-J13_OGT_754m]|nr:ABC transporter ATP-binding protein [SAR202 cluster bacterium AC-409-J13_OGT_754m]